MRCANALCLLLTLVSATAFGQERSPSVNYVLRCAGCHGYDGGGAPQAGIPVFSPSLESFLSDEQGRLYLLHVPGVVSSSLSDAEITGVMNYVIDRWAGEQAAKRLFSTGEVTALRKQPVADVVALRRVLSARYQAEGKPVADYPWP